MINRRLKAFSIPAIILAALLFGTPFAMAREDPGELAEAKLFDRAVGAIGKSYLDSSRVVPRRMLDSALLRIQQTIPEILVRDGGGGNMIAEVGLATKRIKDSPMSSLSDLKRTMRELFGFIATNYSGETKPEEIEYAAIDGMLEALDPHSNFMPPKVYKEFQVGTRGKFGGLGIVISIKDGQLTVIAPIEGTPASAAGVRAGDRILQIDDESTINMSLTDAVNKLRGEVGTKVSIVVERPGKPSRRLRFTRAIISIDSVKHKLIEENGRRIGYIKVKSFQQNTDEDVGAALKSFREGGVKLDGIILDLRNNPGGLLNVAVDLADRFLKSGVIVSTVGARDQVLERESARKAGEKENAPMVVLVNEGSASASEIVAGALQENDRAVVMGRRTFGKGSVQTIFDLGGGSALKLTIAQYKPAGTLDIQLAGLVPDVDLMPVTVDRTAINLVEDLLPSEEDLDAHLEGNSSKGSGESARSPFRVRHLVPKEDEKTLEARSLKEYQKEPEIDEDFNVTVAKRFLAAASGEGREAMLRSGAGALREADSEQAGKMEAELAALGVDWSGHKATGEPTLKLSYRLRSGKKEVSSARAGQKVWLELSATNVGTGSYSQLIAVGQAEYYYVANKEFPFGHLPAGGTRTWSVPIEIPEAMPRGDVIVDIDFEEENGRVPQPLSVLLPVEALPSPSFAFTYTLSPSGKSLSGVKQAALDMTITNAGHGSSSADTAATLSNDCGDKLFIERGRTKLGAMAPKASKRALFRFHLTGEPNADGCALKLAIADMKRLHVLSKKLKLDAKKGKISPNPGRRYAPPVIELKEAPDRTAGKTVSIKGRIRDDDRVRDYFVFVGDKKIAYVPNAGEATELEFSVELPLEPGSNAVVIGARDETDLMSRKTFLINRTSGERKKSSRARGASVLSNMNP
ncbi:MAG TPA: MXAN_5808 family serine peptidase [bacterium]|nr:MXAN_5808 family serine peptidase [bacterium]